MAFVRLFLICLLAAVSNAPVAAQVLFSHGFEDRQIEPVYPIVNGKYQLTSGTAQTQLAWFLEQLAKPDTSIEEINAHFSSGWLSNTLSAEDTRDFIASVRSGYPNGKIIDPVSVTPVSITFVIRSPSDNTKQGWVVFGTAPVGGKIEILGVYPLGTSVMYQQDQALSMSAAADKFQTLSANPALLVARINNQGQCSVIESRLGNELRATASVFKIWVMGGVARAVMAGDITPDQLVALKASEMVAQSRLAREPVGTQFTATDLAIMMLGISDNTATDHLHDLAGRSIINQFVADSGVADPTVLQPLLSINEQFHLFRSFPEVEALTYVNGTESFQNTFLNDEIVPLGANLGNSYFNVNLLTGGSWQASPMDVCHAFGALRNLPNGSDAMRMADLALSAGTAQPYVRPKWDRVWYKGGSLASGAGNHVLTHAWMLENAGGDAYAVIAMSNSPNGGIDANAEYQIQSVTARIMELLAQDATP